MSESHYGFRISSAADSGSQRVFRGRRSVSGLGARIAAQAAWPRKGTPAPKPLSTSWRIRNGCFPSRRSASRSPASASAGRAKTRSTSLIITLLQPVITPVTANVLHAASFVLAFLVMTYFHVVVGEVVPKNLAIERADRLAVDRRSGAADLLPHLRAIRLGHREIERGHYARPGRG